MPKNSTGTRDTGPVGCFSQLLSSPAAGWVILGYGALLVLFVGAWEREVSGTAGFYAALSRQIAETGSWNPILHGDVPYVNKPPLQLWLTALTMKVLGPTSLAATLWQRVFGVACVFLAAALGRALYGTAAGFFAGLILLANGTFVENTTTFRLEASLLFGNLVCLWAYFSPSGRWRQPVFFLGLVFAILSKGGAGLVPVPLVLLHAALARKLVRPWAPEARPWLAWSTLLILPIAWYVDQYFRLGSWVVAQLGRDYGRAEITGLMPKLQSGVKVYLANPLVQWLPFSPFMAWGLVRATREAARPSGPESPHRPLAVAFVVFAVVLTAALILKGTHRIRYLCLVLPVFTTLGGREVARLARGRVPLAVTGSLAALFLAATFVLAIARPTIQEGDGAEGIEIVRRLVDAELGPRENPAPVLVPDDRKLGAYGGQDTTTDWVYLYLGRRVTSVPLSAVLSGSAPPHRLYILPDKFWKKRLHQAPVRVVARFSAVYLAELLPPGTSPEPPAR